MKTKNGSCTLGRPRAFDADEALGCALRVFWHKGYEGTSLTDLTAAMGINRPSLYAAYGNKEELFRKVLDRYTENAAGLIEAALGAPTAREAVARLLHGAADSARCPNSQRGCLLVSGALACGEEAGAIRRELADRRAATVAQVRRRLEQAQAAGDLSADASAEDLARYVVTLVHGMSVQAMGGADHAQLRRVADVALAGWPSK